MTRMLLVLVAVTLLSGCKVTAGFYVEKDWQTDTDLFRNPDLRTKAKLEMARDFKSWSELRIKECEGDQGS